MAGHPDDDYNRDILDIIPERFDADADSYQARAGSRLRNWLILGGAVLAVGVAVAVGWRVVAGSSGGGNGIATITADQRPIKIRPDDRGGMQVPNQDKLVYGRLEQADGDAKVERLLPAPEQPVVPQSQSQASQSQASQSQAMTNAPAVPEVPSAHQDVLKPPPVPAMPPMTAALKPTPPTAPVAVKPTPPAAVAIKPVEPVAKPAPVKPVEIMPAKPVPAKPATPAPKVVVTSPAMTPPTPAIQLGGDHLVQLGALRSAADAEKEWSRIQRTNSDLLAGLKSDVMQVDLGAKGVFWRLRAGPLTEQSARHVCGELKSRNQGCMVVRK